MSKHFKASSLLKGPQKRWFPLSPPAFRDTLLSSLALSPTPLMAQCLGCSLSRCLW